MFNNFFPKYRAIFEISMGKYGTTTQATGDSTMQHTKSAICNRITKARTQIHTHFSEALNLQNVFCCSKKATLYTFLFQNVTGCTRTSHVESLDPVCQRVQVTQGCILQTDNANMLLLRVQSTPKSTSPSQLYSYHTSKYSCLKEAETMLPEWHMQTHMACSAILNATLELISRCVGLKKLWLKSTIIHK